MDLSEFINFAPGMNDPVIAQVSSMNRTLKAIAKERRGLFNRLLSIEADTVYVQSVAAALDPLPTLANLRCGRWYTPEPRGICRFKSMDGHVNRWTFSFSRLNTHVARLAVEHGGVIIVDATGGNKLFPDALSKTIPLWAAVVSSAILGHTIPPTFPGGNALSEYEKDSISDLVEPFAVALREANISEFPHLTKPLVPVFAERDKDPAVVAGEVAALKDEGVIPLVLVSASFPSLGPPVRAVTGEEDAIPPPVFPKTGYWYIGGAGDDEEGWAKGLTPSLFWSRRRELLGSPDGVETVLPREVVRWKREGKEEQVKEDANTNVVDVISPLKLSIGSASSRMDTSRYNYILNVGSVDPPGIQTQREDPPTETEEAGKPKYLRLDVRDGKAGAQDMPKVYEQAIAFIDEAVRNDKDILVYCDQGINRSVVAVLAYAVCHLDNSFKRIERRMSLTRMETRLWLARITAKRPQALPNQKLLKTIASVIHIE